MAYEKYKDPWTVADLLTGRALNHLETQWDEIKADADVHNHDARYYTKTIADATFFSTTFHTGFDADTIDTLHYADLTSSALPVGAILYWPSESAVPSGWHKCDGAGGTTDLRDMFIMGAGATYDPEDTGGALTQAITGTVTIGNHSVTNDEMPIHTHPYTDNKDIGNWNYQVYYADPDSGAVSTSTHHDYTSGSTGSGNTHGHTGSTITLNDIDITPPYYALYLIQKVS